MSPQGHKSARGNGRERTGREPSRRETSQREPSRGGSSQRGSSPEGSYSAVNSIIDGYAGSNRESQELVSRFSSSSDDSGGPKGSKRPENSASQKVQDRSGDLLFRPGSSALNSVRSSNSSIAGPSLRGQIQGSRNNPPPAKNIDPKYINLDAHKFLIGETPHPTPKGTEGMKGEGHKVSRKR